MTTYPITVLPPRASVRHRPGMYFDRGALSVAFMALDSALEHAVAGRCTRIDVHVDVDGIVVTDDGPGLPIAGAGRRRSLVQRLEWSAPPTGDDGVFGRFEATSRGLMYANAASERFEIVTVHEGQRATARYSRGDALAPLQVEPSELATGTRICVRPDPALFADPTIPHDALQARLVDLSWLLPQVRLSWTGAEPRVGCGLPELVRTRAAGNAGPVAHRRTQILVDEAAIAVDVALAWRGGSHEAIELHTFLNLTRTPVRKDFAAGVRQALEQMFGRRGAVARRRGLIAAASVVSSGLADHNEPFGSPMHTLGTPRYTRAAVKQATLAALEAWAAEHPEAAAELRRRR